jgi:transposase
LNPDLISYVLPSELLVYFEITQVEELCSLETKEVFISVELEEKNSLPNPYRSSEYESKGFLSSKTVQDFPLRGKAVYLTIKRRRWRHKETKKEIRGNYSFLAEGSKLTQELSDFLKGTGRYPRRFH